MSRHGRLGLSRFPWSLRDPLAFHTLVGNPPPCEELLRAGARLVPVADRSLPGAREGWGDATGVGQIEAIDTAAGDDRCLFFTALRELRGDDVDEVSVWWHTPAFAFPVDALARHGKVYWGPYDLMGAYNEVAFDPRGRRRPIEKATIDELHRVRRLLRVEGERAVVRLMRLEAMLLRHPERQPAVLRAAGQVFGDRPGRDKLLTPFRNSWGRAGARWEGVLALQQGPEVLLEGSVPVVESAFFRGTDGRWHGTAEFLAGEGPA